MVRTFITLWVILLPIALLMSQNTTNDIKQSQQDTTVKTGNFNLKTTQDVSKEQLEVGNSNSTSALSKYKSLYNIKTILIMTIVLFLIVVFIMLFLYRQHQQLEKINTVVKNNSNKRSYNNDYSHLNTAVNVIVKEVEQLKNTLDNLERKVDQLQSSQLDKHSEQPVKKEEDLRLNDEKNQKTNNTNSNNIERKPEKQNIFFPSPLDNLTFSGRDASNTKDNSSIYVVIYNTDNNTGELTILNDANIGRALNSPEMYLEPVCEYLNEFDSTKNIYVNEPGIIKKDGDHWIVTKKIKIEFK